VSDFSTITHCKEITDDHIRDALESRESTKALLDRAIEIAKPREAGSRILLVFAKMASPDCDWLEGALRIEMTADGQHTNIESLVDIGAGLKERVFPKMRAAVPLEEFLAAIKKFPQAIAPLTAESPSRDRLRLVAQEAEKRMDSDAPKKAARVRTLGYEDMPTVGKSTQIAIKKPTSQPPPGTMHRPPDVASAALKPVERRPLGKIALRKSPLSTTGGIAEEVGPKKEFVDASTKNPKIRKPPPFVQPPPDVDGGWDEDKDK
jgi:hypothetical protein